MEMKRSVIAQLWMSMAVGQQWQLCTLVYRYV